MKKKSIIKNLSKRPFIYGISGFLFIDYWNGKKDSKSYNQNSDDISHVPWVEKKKQTLLIYENKIYLKVDHFLESVSKTVSKACKELSLISGACQTLVPTDAENDARTSHANAITMANRSARSVDIILHLAEIRAELTSLNAAVDHHIQRSEHGADEPSPFLYEARCF